MGFWPKYNHSSRGISRNVLFRLGEDVFPMDHLPRLFMKAFFVARFIGIAVSHRLLLRTSWPEGLR
jgi:hypothetical protein